MATYEQTHRWITFQLDLRSPTFEFWLLAGEALSKCEHLAGVALRPEAARRLMEVYLAKGVQATTAIEGNTLTEEQVLERIQGKLELPPSKAYLGVEVGNILEACNEIGKQYVAGELPPITPDLICGFNEHVLRNLHLDEQVQPGKIRTYSVGVAYYRGAPPADVPELMRKLCDWLAQSWLEPLDCYQQHDLQRLEAILKAVIAHLYLAWIHPFGDGNGRTARLLEFYILVGAGVPFPAAHLLSNHYNQTRSEYYRQLSIASKSGGKVIPFCKYALQGFVDQLREQILAVRDEQLELFWQNHVHKTLGESETGRRRTHVVLDLTNAARHVPRDKMTDVSPRVARDYARKDEKTLVRDLAELERLELIVKEKDGYRAKTEVVLAYVPGRRHTGG
jgi:Fic family protein